MCIISFNVLAVSQKETILAKEVEENMIFQTKCRYVNAHLNEYNSLLLT